MKRFFALAALLLGLAACQTEPEGLNVNVGGAVDTTITVAIPEGTRASSDQGFDLSTLGTNYSLRYILEIYRVENGNVLYNNCQRFVETSNNSQPMVFPVRLAQDYDYQIVAWADIVVKDSKDDRYYYTQAGLDEIAILDNGTVNWNAMDETRDAYTYAKRITKFNSASDLNMPLTRPFAKLRVVATDIDDIRAVGLEPTTATVTYSQDMFFKYNAVADVENKGTAYHTAEKTHEFTYSTTATKYDVQTGEFTLFSDYIFVPSTGTAKFTLKVYADEAQSKLIKENNFSTEIFVQRNKLTTIKGDVLTVGGNVEVKVENGWGELETYTYVSSGADLIKAINSNGKSILGNNITVNEDDIALAGRLAATRSTDSKSVINLNGFTITVNNTSATPLVTLTTVDTLVFAGEGDIVMTSESTAPFVNTNDAIVIIEQATVTTESNQGAAVVDGNAIVNAAANVNEGAVSGEVEPQLEYVLANGGEVTLFEDVTSDKILEISATNPVVINGNGKTITFTANRGFRITASNNVTIENATIVNDVNGGRCIETRTGNINLTLNNVNLTATYGASQPFTVGGSGNGITVNINNSTITSGNGGYGITTFNPVALNINNSTVSGYAVLNIKAASSSLGSNGSEINIVNSTLNGVNNVPAHESNSFSTIEIEDNNIEINVDSTSTIKATTSNGNGQCIVGFGNSLVTSIISDCKLTFAGNIVLEGDHTSFVGYSSYQGGLGGNKVKFAAKYADELEAEGWIVGEPTDGFVTISSAIAQVGDNMYKTLAEAVAAAKTGDTITVLQNTTLSESLTLPAGIIFNGNGKEITGTIVAGGNLTFVGHTKVTSFSASYYDRVITISEGACLEVTGTGRVTLGYGNTFNITGSIENAKTADKANIQPSLIIPGGISITGGNDATMKVTNAYVKIGSTTSKPGVANGTFTLNFNNAIAEFTKELGFYDPTGGVNPTFIMNIEDSVFTTGTKIFVTANSEVNVDNSVVTLGSYLANRGTLNLTNGSVLTGKTIQFGENGGNNGTINVDASTLTITAGSTGHAFDGQGIGKINATNGATVSVDYYKDMTITVDATSTFTGVDVDANKKIYYTGDMKVDPTNAEAFGGATIASSSFENGKGVIKFDRDVTTIGFEAFRRNSNTDGSNWWTSITLPETVTSIGNYAFYQNFSLETINIPDNVVSIGEYAFSSCNAVTSVTIGSKVANLASGAFYASYQIKEIICKPTTPPTLANKWVFYEVEPERVVVPADSVDAYKAAWSMFADKIVAGEF